MFGDIGKRSSPKRNIPSAVFELARKSFYLSTVVVVLCAVVLSAGRMLSMYPSHLQQFVNAELLDQGIEVSGLKSSWRLTNPIIEIDLIRFPEGTAHDVEVEVAVLESLIRNQFVARRLAIDELNLDIEVPDQKTNESPDQETDFNFLNLVDQIQTNFDRVRHTDELAVTASLRLRGEHATQDFRMSVHAVNQGGMHRYRARLRQEDLASGGSAEFVADAVDTLLDLRTGDYQMSLYVNDLEVNLPLLTGNTRLPRYLLAGHGEWELVDSRVQGHLAADVTNIDRESLRAHLEATFVQNEDEAARFRIKTPSIDASDHSITLPDLVIAFDDDALLGSTYNVPLKELVPIVSDFVSSGERQVRWPTGIALQGVFHRYEFLLDSSGFHWYAGARDLASKSFENLPQMQLRSGSLYGNIRQIALDADNTEGRLFLDSHFDSPWQFASVAGFAVTDIRNQQVGLHMRDFEVHIASEQAERTNPDSQLDVSSLLRRADAEIQLNELIYEPVSATFRGSVRHAQGDTPNYNLAMLIESRNTLLPAHQTVDFIPSNLVEDLTRWRKQYLESASFFGTRVAYMTFRDEVYTQNEREMQIEGQFTNGTVVYQPEWPELSNVGGTWYVDNDSVMVKTDRVTVQKTELDNAIATFPLDSDRPFRITFGATLKTQDLLDFVQASELKSWIPAIDASWNGAGLVTVNADLSFPLNTPNQESGTVEPKPGNHLINVQMHDATLNMPDLGIEFREINGNANWRSPYHLEADISRGTFFDEPMAGKIVTTHDDEQPAIEFHLSSRINAENALTIAGLQDSENGIGATDFNARLYVFPASDKPSELFINSDLVGIEFETLNLVARNTSQPNPSGMQLAFSNDRTELTVQSRDVNGWLTWGGTPASILEGALALGTATDVPDRVPNHLHLSGSLDSWLYSTDDSDELGVPISLTDVDIERFIAFEHEFSNVEINGAYSNDSLDVSLESEEFSGTIVKQVSQAHMEIHASQLRWSFASGDNGVDPLDVAVMSQIKPTKVRIDELLLQSDDLTFESWGQWEFMISPMDSGIEVAGLKADARGLRIESSAPITWHRDANETAFNGKIYGENLGAILEAWDFNASVESEQFEVSADIQWPGSPMAMNIENASGQFEAAASNGRFLEIDQGGDVLRLISLLNFSKILNRLALDFKDVTQTGLHYDSASMAVTLEEGLISFTEPLKIDGPSARLRFAGKVDSRTGELDNDLTVRIPLHKGLQTYVAYLAATNPPAAFAYLLGTLIISEPLKALLTAQYDITGDLNNPILTRVAITPTQSTQVAAP